MLSISDIHGDTTHIRVLTEREARARYAPVRAYFRDRALWHLARDELNREGVKLIRLAIKALDREAGAPRLTRREG